MDVAKPEPERMDFDFDLVVSSDTVAAPAVNEPDATPPAPPRPGARGRARARAGQPDPPAPAPVTPPPATPERQALINALYSQKARSDSERLQEIYNLKVKLASTDCVTKELMSLFKEKEPGYAQLPPRQLSMKTASAYDAFVSQDG